MTLTGGEVVCYNPVMEVEDVKVTMTVGEVEIEKKGNGPAMLSPTFWRTVRSLKNVNRLNLLKSVYNHGGNMGVVDIAKENRVSEPVASDYLRKMNARGIISVKRNATFVYYGTLPDRSLPRAISLQKGFREYFSRELPKGWQRELCAIMKGFSHYNRLNILRLLFASGRSRCCCGRLLGRRDV